MNNKLHSINFNNRYLVDAFIADNKVKQLIYRNIK